MADNRRHLGGKPTSGRRWQADGGPPAIFDDDPMVAISGILSTVGHRWPAVGPSSPNAANSHQRSDGGVLSGIGLEFLRKIQ